MFAVLLSGLPPARNLLRSWDMMVLRRRSCLPFAHRILWPEFTRILSRCVVLVPDAVSIVISPTGRGAGAAGFLKLIGRSTSRVLVSRRSA